MMGNQRTEKLLPRNKLWIVDQDGGVLFGWGRKCILEIIRDTGSMNKAAMELGMSFRTLWGKIRETERRLGFKLVKNKKGNRRSGSVLTPEGEEFLQKFTQLKQEVNRSVDGIFQRIFGDFSNLQIVQSEQSKKKN